MRARDGKVWLIERILILSIPYLSRLIIVSRHSRHEVMREIVRVCELSDCG